MGEIVLVVIQFVAELVIEGIGLGISEMWKKFWGN
jgi:hypothetical protein